MIPAEIASRMGSIDWFANCGTPTHRGRVHSWAEAASSCAGERWVSITEEAAGRLTADLSLRCPGEFSSWNPRVRVVKDEILAVHLDPALEQLPSVVADCARWDVLNAAMELWFRNCRKPGFFLSLLEEYEQGRFPCGWSGQWPEGDVVVL